MTSTCWREGRSLPGGGIMPARSLQNHLFPGLGLGRHMPVVDGIQVEATRPVLGVVAGDAVLLRHRMQFLRARRH